MSGVLGNPSGRSCPSYRSMRSLPRPVKTTSESLFPCLFSFKLLLVLKSKPHSPRCPVCLCEYQEKEKLQQLPACKHAFHVECIDQWLAKNTTCPICRTSLLQGGGKDVVTGVQSTASPIENTRWQDRVLNEGQEIVRHNNDISDGASSSSTAIASSEAAPRFSTEHVVNIERS
jgi:hypothetical protein